MTKEEVLQKVNDYCNEKSYTEETLTSEFKDKFSEFFAKKYSEETAIDTEGILEDIKFNINTAFSATSKGLTSKQKAFETKENEYKNTIAELNKKIGKPQEKIVELPDEVKQQLAELEKFKDAKSKKDKFDEIVKLAKKGIRPDLYASFEKYAQEYDVTLDSTSEEQAKKLTARFQEIFKDSIGDIKPLVPKVSQKRDEEFVASIPKVQVM
ncbi:MAG: hypothetical protein ACOCPA_00675 [Segatella copri]